MKVNEAILLRIIYVLLGLAGALAFAYMCNKMSEGGSVSYEKPVVVSDTCIVFDTIKVYKAVPKDSTVIKYIKVPLPVSNDKAKEPVKDQIVKPDSVKADSVDVVIPITQKVFGDSRYTAYVSGYKPNLDSLIFHNQKEFITVKETYKPKQKRWGLGIQVGASMRLGEGFSHKNIYPYVGIGISYNLFTW